MSSSVPSAKTQTSNIIFFINKPLSHSPETNQVYYVVDLSDSMFRTMYYCAYPPGEKKYDFAARGLFQKNKLCMTLEGHGIWTRDKIHGTRIPFEINHQKPKKKEIALQLIDEMLKKVASQDTDEKRAKYMEYLHLRNKIFVFPITSLQFMFYHIKEDSHFRDFDVHISDEPAVNPVLGYQFEMVNYSLRPAAEGIKDFEEPGPLKQPQSGLTLYRGPTIPVPIFPRPDSEDPLVESIKMIGIEQEKTIQEFNERRRKLDQLVIDEIIVQKEEAEREAATLQALRNKQNTLWNRVKNTAWSFIPIRAMGGKSKRAKRVKSRRVKSRRIKSYKSRRS